MKVFLFFDYDGTLVSFKLKPEQAKPTKELVKLIKELSLKKNFIVSIVSGRTMKELKHFFPLKNLVFASCHGMQINFPYKKNFVFRKAEKSIPLIKKIDSASRKKFSFVNGILFQNKKFAFVLHYRNVKQKEHKKIKSAFRKLVKETDLGKQLEVIQGAMVLEARIKGWNKGNAVKEIMKKEKRKKTGLVFYFGDDLTDEDAFNALKNDFTFLVSEKKRSTKARFMLKNPEKVILFLRVLSKTFL